jgi:hypothetical protein
MGLHLLATIGGGAGIRGLARGRSTPGYLGGRGLRFEVERVSCAAYCEHPFLLEVVSPRRKSVHI